MKLLLMALILSLVSFSLFSQPIKGGGKFIMQLGQFLVSSSNEIGRCTGQDNQFKTLEEMYVYLMLRLHFGGALSTDIGKSPTTCHAPLMSAINSSCVINPTNIKEISVLNDPQLVDYLMSQGHTKKSARDMIKVINAYLGQED